MPIFSFTFGIAGPNLSPKMWFISRHPSLSLIHQKGVKMITPSEIRDNRLSQKSHILKRNSSGKNHPRNVLP